MAIGRVFILESPNPLDLLENRGERQALEQVCKLVGHDASTFLLRDLNELKQTFGFIGTIKGDEEDKTPLFIHLSVHGNNSGIRIGPDRISWNDLAKNIGDMYTHLRYYHGPIILILSACGANRQKLTTALTNSVKSNEETFVPPEYVFVFSDDEVLWTDAVVTWTIFYNETHKLDFEAKKTIQNLLNRLHNSGFGNLQYSRWDATMMKYIRFVPKDN
jgi:hypothetical protein